MINQLNSERFADQSPRQVYSKLLDEGEYLCSVRTMYRILEENQSTRERRNQLKHPNYEKPELLATGPNEVWSWDITKLKGPEKWTYSPNVTTVTATITLNTRVMPKKIPGFQGLAPDHTGCST